MTAQAQDNTKIKYTINPLLSIKYSRKATKKTHT